MQIQIDDIIENKTIQLGTETQHTKFEMLMLFQKVFQTKFIILPIITNNTINRSLVPNIISQSLELQLNELKIFIDLYFNNND